MKKRMLALSGLLVAALPLLAETGTVGTYTYNYIDNGDGTVTLSCYDAYGSWVGGVSPAPVGEFTVPGMIDGKRVVAIGDSYFYSCSDLTGVIIPDSVTRIGDSAFHSSGLTNVTIPDSVTTIGGYAFYGCNELVSVTMSTNIVSYGWGVFASCSSLTSVTIPEGVTLIGMSEFKDCRGLTNVVIPASVSRINDEAFAGCTGLKSFDVSVANQYYKAEDGFLLSKDGSVLVAAIGGLSSATIPNGVMTIGGSVFDGNDELASITIPDSVKNIGNRAFCYCSGLTNITLPDSVTSIGDAAFAGCSGLTNIVIPASVADIGGYAFIECSGLMSFDVSTDNQWYRSIDGLLLSKDGSVLVAVPGGLTSVTVPVGVTSIGTYAFECCSGLTSVTIPDGVMHIEYGAFDSCSSLTSVTIPDSVTSIMAGAFTRCSALTSVTIGNGVTSIGERAFEDCSDLANVNLPETLHDQEEYLLSYVFVCCATGLQLTYYPVTTFDVTFNANGGTIDGEGVSVETIVEGHKLIQQPTPTRDGYAFLGWFTAATGGDEVTADTVVTGDMTLYAHWEEITYTYNYIDNGDGTVTLSRYDADGYWVYEPISPSPVGEFTVPVMIDGKRVVAIGDRVFDDYYGMTSLIIPASVTNLTTYAFNRSYDLTNIAVAADNPAYKSVDGVLYTKDGKTLVAWPQGTGGNVVVAFGTECIGDAAFNNNYNLTSVSLPNGLKIIENDAFAYCENLDFTSVTIPASVEAIGDYAFRNCSNLSTVSFLGSEGDIDIADTAFVGTPYDAMGPFSLIIDEYGNLIGIHGAAPGNLVLADCLNGQTLTGLADYALSGGRYETSALTNAVVPMGVTWIGYGAFMYCTALREVQIPATVTSMGNDVFYGCTDLTVYAPSTLRDTFYVPDGCSIEYYDVSECTVMFNANGGTIDGEAIAEMTVLQGRTLDNWPIPYREGYDFAGWFDPDGKRMQDNFVVTEDVTFTARWREPSPWSYDPCYQGEDGEQIGVVVMGAECIVVTNGVLTIPATLTALNDNGEEVEMPVVGIGSYAFEDWDLVETLVLPECVKEIGWGAFGWCHSLTNVTFLGNRELIDMDIGQAFMQTPWLDAQPFTWMTSEEDDEVYLNGFYGSPVPDDTLVIPAGVTVMRPSALPYWYTVSDGDGYRRFLGWYTAAEGGVQADAGRWNGEVVEIAGGTTLYARWEAAEPEWFFDVEDGQAIITGNAVSLVGDVEIPASVTVEEDDGEGNVTDVPYPVVAIAEDAFCDTEITSVTIPASVTNIGDGAFEDCANLTNVVFVGGMPGIEMRVASAFYGTPWLEAHLASLPAPDNDDLADAAQIAGASGRTTGTNMGAGIEDGEPLGLRFDSTATVWWRWTAPTNGSFMFTTQGSSFDTVMGVYTGTVVDSLVMVAEDDDHGPDSTSAVAFDAVAGTMYYICVGGYAENVGDIVLSWDVDKGVIVEAGDNIVAENGDGTYTITAPAGGELTEDDVDGIEVMAKCRGEWVYTTDGYDVVFGGGVITVSLKKPEVNTDIYSAAKDPDDKSGFLVDPEVVKVAAEPDVGEGETLGAMPVKAVPGLWYRASWGDSLHGMTTGEAVQADDPELYLGVIRQDGASGFYKVSVSDHAQ